MKNRIITGDFPGDTVLIPVGFLQKNIEIR